MTVTKVQKNGKRRGCGARGGRGGDEKAGRGGRRSTGRNDKENIERRAQDGDSSEGSRKNDFKIKKLDLSPGEKPVA